MIKYGFYEIIATLFQLITLFMLVRSAFYVVRVRREFGLWAFVVMMMIIASGSIITAYNILDPFYVIQRFPFNSIFYLGSAWVFYVVTKSKKEDLFKITNVVARELTREEKLTVKKINHEPTDSDVEVVNFSDLDVIQKHKQLVLSNKLLLMRLDPPANKGIDFKFISDMLPGAYYKTQQHNDLFEIINIDEGMVLETYSKRVYYAGDTIVLPPKTIHGLKAIDRTKISAYLTKTKVYHE